MSGQNAKYDYFHSCYGNPDSKIVFIAEIPSLEGLNDALNKVPKNRLWATPWYGDGKEWRTITFRECLMLTDLIPPFCEHEPWNWNCWITNFVKCPEKDGLWHAKGQAWEKLDNSKKNHLREIKKKALADSANFLQEEMDCINPSYIVFIGDSAENYYKANGLGTQLKRKKPKLLRYKIMHYSARKSRKYLRDRYITKFKSIKKKCLDLSSKDT